MELTFSPHLGIFVERPNKEFKPQDLELKISTNRAGGYKSHCIGLSIDSKEEHSVFAGPSIVWIDLNRNEARYLIAGLTAFVNVANRSVNRQLRGWRIPIRYVLFYFRKKRIKK